MIGELLREFSRLYMAGGDCYLEQSEAIGDRLASSLSCHFSVYRRKLSRRAECIHPWAELINLMRGLVEPQQERAS
ncbi:hydrogenase-1 operon protein [Escherichia coli]|uniref:Hydrogenase-1 operon protein n=1 Tax=Escherichia coli TaxID=562 RepID=A0A377ATK3_ECOLX|nr:hydrogenase-1 operon protein [Escherichia coli]